MQALRPLRTGWPKSGQSFLFLLMLGLGSQRSRKQLFGGSSSPLLQAGENH